MERSVVTVERVGSLKPWLRTLREGDVRVIFLSPDHYRTLDTKISQVNAEWRDSDINRFSHYLTNGGGVRACVVCISLDEREKELEDINIKDEWKKKVPRFFHSKDIWAVGTKH